MLTTTLTPEIHAARFAAALQCAIDAEEIAGVPGGARRLLGIAELLVSNEQPVEGLVRRGLDQAGAGGQVALVSAAAVAGLVAPTDRPWLRRMAHTLVRAAGGDEGTAVVGIAAAMLAADLCRHDLEWSLVRVHQSLLEEAPTALLVRLRPLAGATVLHATGDPGAALQLSLTVLAHAGDVQTCLADVPGWSGEAEAAAAVAVLTGLLGGALWGIGEPVSSRVADLRDRLVVPGGSS